MPRPRSRSAYGRWDLRVQRAEQQQLAQLFATCIVIRELVAIAMPKHLPDLTQTNAAEALAFLRLLQIGLLFARIYYRRLRRGLTRLLGAADAGTLPTLPTRPSRSIFVRGSTGSNVRPRHANAMANWPNGRLFLTLARPSFKSSRLNTSSNAMAPVAAACRLARSVTLTGSCAWRCNAPSRTARRPATWRRSMRRPRLRKGRSRY